MTKILCATRGGEASRRTQERAIALARQHNAELIFLYVFDLDFLERVQAATIPTVAKDMQHMSEFFLTM
ncbi:MAG: universal stress protein, partial [Anaerolineae bacterium]|nr:universal stress protein [Anaerolineae bacterium]